ncbi:MAG: MGMT family protein, partial [Candidatus Sulfotelmatobacter sp.]
QVACWRALRAIPYSETRSYAEIAKAVGKPNAFRAVGMANNRNQPHQHDRAPTQAKRDESFEHCLSASLVNGKLHQI